MADNEEKPTQDAAPKDAPPQEKHKPEKKVRIAEDVVNIVSKDDVEEEEGAEAGEEEEDTTPRTHKTILIAVDGSAISNEAVKWYLDELHHTGNHIVFIHSFELPLMHSYQEITVSADMWQATLQREADRTTRMEKNLMRKLKARGIEGKFLARGGGKPGEAILKTAEEENIDMIVLGTRGHGRFMRMVLGSVSHHVMNHAHCPVLVYRRQKKREQQHHDETTEDDAQDPPKIGKAKKEA